MTREERLRALGLVSRQMRRLRGDLRAAISSPQGGCKEAGAGQFLEGAEDRRRSCRLTSQRETLRLEVGNRCLTRRVGKHGHRFLVASPSLEVLRSRLDKASAGGSRSGWSCHEQGLGLGVTSGGPSDPCIIGFCGSGAGC